MHTEFVGIVRKEETTWESRWASNIKMSLKEIKCNGADWIHLVLYRNQWQTLVTVLCS